MARKVIEERKKGDKLRNKILKRDNYQCVLCKSIEDIEVHHMQAIVRGGSSIENNLITLCSECHRYAPENSIEENHRFLAERNKNIFERMISSPELNSMISVAYVEYLKTKINEYVELGFIDEQQKNFILMYEGNAVLDTSLFDL